MGLTPKRGYEGESKVVYPCVIDHSAYFPGWGDVSYMHRTFAPDSTDRTRATFHIWVKPRTYQEGGYSWAPFGCGSATSAKPRFIIMSGVKTVSAYDFQVYQTNASGTCTCNYRADAGFINDPTNWAAICVVIDTNEAAAEDRCRLYWNMQRIPMTVTTPLAQGSNINWGDSAYPHFVLGAVGSSSGVAVVSQPNVSIADPIHVEGQALGPEHFEQWSGAIPSLNVPKPFSGTYGTNGFYLDFNDGANLGKDVSGNGNDFTVVGSPVQTLDTPTNNYCTLNASAPDSYTKEGNLFLDHNTSSTGNSVGYGTHPLPASGKYYAEVECVNIQVQTTWNHVGVAIGSDALNGAGLEQHRLSKVTWCEMGHTWTGLDPNTPLGYLPEYRTGDILSVLVDCDANEVRFWHNGQSNTRVFPLPFDSEGYSFLSSIHGNQSQLRWRFGATDFTYTPPAGYTSLCAANLPDPEILDPATGNDVVLYQGNGTALDIGGMEFSPDWGLVKGRTNEYNWRLADAVRGAINTLQLNSPAASTVLTNNITAFLADGLSLGSHASVNESGKAFLAHCLKRGPEYGFDIVQYTGDGVAGKQIAHNCGGVPEFIIVKCVSGSQNWGVYHVAAGATKYALLNDTRVFGLSSTIWNDTEPTATHFTVGDWTGVNQDGFQYVAYLFRSVPGFSKVFSYKGNGVVDGPFVDLGFRPKTWIIKSAGGVASWVMQNTEVNPTNRIDRYLKPDLPEAEGGPYDCINATAGGMKILHPNGGFNVDGNLHVGIAWAEQPFKYSNGF